MKALYVTGILIVAAGITWAISGKHIFHGSNEKKQQIHLHTAETGITPAELTSKNPGDADFPVPGKDSLRHLKKLADIHSKKYDLVLIGNSIIQTLGEYGGRFEPLKKVWDRHFKPRHALNLGYSGYRTENILWNLQHGELSFISAPKVAILLIGTNNADERRFKTVHTPAQILKGTKAIVNQIRVSLPETKIIVLRIFPRGGDNDTGTGKAQIHSSDSCIAKCREAGLLTKELADNKYVFWADLTSVFLLVNGRINTRLLPDLLHPGEAGAEAWAEELEPLLSTLMGDKPIHCRK